jgi:hypothetical protein
LHEVFKNETLSSCIDTIGIRNAPTLLRSRTMARTTMERALKMAVVTGLRAALGPALVARSQYRPERQNLALAAMGEMVFDKIPHVPDRDTLLPLLARGVAGAWVVKRCQEEDGDTDPWLVPLGIAVAMGVAVAAPKLRKILGWTTGISQPMLGVAEDYFAIRLGSEALGLSMDQVSHAARESVEDLKERFQPAEYAPVEFQSAGAGSM